MLLLLRNSMRADPPLVPFVPSGSFVGYGVEGVFNGLVSPNVYIPASRMDFSDTFDYRFVQTLRRDLSKDKYSKGSFSYAGSIDTVLTSSGMGGILCSLLGCEAPEGGFVGGGYYSYNFRPSYLNGPSLSLAVNTETSLGDGLVVRRSGAIVSALSISANFGEPVTARTEVVGATSILGSILDFVPSWQDVDGLSFDDVSVFIDDIQVSDVKSLECTIANGIEPLYVIRSDSTPRFNVRRSFDVTLSMEIGLEDADYWTYLKDSEEIKVRIDIDNGSDSFIIDMVRMITQSSSLPVEASTSRDNTQSIELVSLGGTFVPVSLTLEARYF